MPDIDVKKIRFRKMVSFRGQHSFWEELAGFNRIAIADQSIMRMDGSSYQPQDADHGLLFVDFHTLVEDKYVMTESRDSTQGYTIYALPVVDIDGNKYSCILVKEEYEWFMKRFAGKKE